MVDDLDEKDCANWQLAESDVAAAGGAEELLTDDVVERPVAVADGLVGKPVADDADKRDARPVAGVSSVGVELSYIAAIALQTVQLSAVKGEIAGVTNLRMVL